MLHVIWKFGKLSKKKYLPLLNHVSRAGHCTISSFTLNESETEIIVFGSSQVPNIFHVNSGVFSS